MAAYERNSCLASFVRELGAKGLCLDDLADWLGMMSGPELIHRGGMLPKDFVLGQVHTGEGITPAASGPWPEALALGRELIRLNTQIARLLDRWDGDGMPRSRSHDEN